MQTVPDGEIPHHVRPRHRQPQQEVRDLQQLQTQKGKVVGQDLSLYFVFFHSGTEVFASALHLTTLVIPDDFGPGHMKHYVGKIKSYN